MNRKFIKNSNLVLRQILSENNSIEILKNFVENILNIKIKELKINETPKIEQEKTKEYGIVDMRIKLETEEEINVGIQIIDGEYIQNKMLLYYAKIHSNQILYKDKRKIARTIIINILDDKFFSSEEYHKTIKIKTNCVDDNILETIELHVLELPKFNIEKNTDISEKEAWILYLQGIDEQIIKCAKENNSSVKKLDELLQKYWDEEII